MSRPEPRWVQPLAAATAATRVRLFCFPYAGGGTAMFRDWARELPAEIQVYGIALPGREARMLEPPIGDLQAVLAELVPAMLPYLGVPFAFFGHSMGAMISWELARSLRSQAGMMPAHLFVSGCRPLPASQLWLANFESLSDVELAEQMRKLNGTPDEVLRDPDLLQLVLPGFRADLALLAGYKYQPAGRLDCRATIFGGDQDPIVPAGELAGWAELTTGDVDVRVLPGDHFFVYTARAEVLAAITSKIGPSQI